MKELMKSNIYDVSDTIMVIGSCLPVVCPMGYEKLRKITDNIYHVCLEEIHMNMVITKIGGMLRTGRIKKIVFATVDKSPHCIQLHYVSSELKKMMKLDNIVIENYVLSNNELIEVNDMTISLSKNLKMLSSLTISDNKNS